MLYYGIGNQYGSSVLHVPSELETDHVEIGTYRTYYYTSEQIAQCATL